MTDIILDEQDRKAESADRANLVATMSDAEFDEWMAAQETDVELEQADTRRALARKDAEIAQLIHDAREMQTELDRLESEARERRFASETMYHEEPMW